MKNLFNKLKKGLLPAQEVMPAQTEATAEHASAMPVTPLKREAIIAFIVQSLRPYVDERSMSVAGLRFYWLCNGAAQEEAASVALCMDKPGMFKSEYLERRLLNHFIQLEPNWYFEYELVHDQLPAGCMQQGNFALKVVRAAERVTDHYTKARIQVLVGQTEEADYVLDPTQKIKYYIGRSKSPQLATGKIQLNDIVFLGKEDRQFDEVAGRANLHVSRNHAYIAYEPRSGRYFLYPDKGGLPDNGNKLKVHTANDQMLWLNIYGVGHLLQDGDQIELGGEAVLRFQSFNSIQTGA